MSSQCHRVSAEVRGHACRKRAHSLPGLLRRSGPRPRPSYRPRPWCTSRRRANPPLKRLQMLTLAPTPVQLPQELESPTLSRTRSTLRRRLAPRPKHPNLLRCSSRCRLSSLPTRHCWPPPQNSRRSPHFSMRPPTTKTKKTRTRSEIRRPFGLRSSEPDPQQVMSIAALTCMMRAGAAVILYYIILIC